jgi:lipoprotein Spr
MRRAALLLALLLVHGCGWMPWHEEEPREPPPVEDQHADEVRATLIDQWQDWRGVPYRMGGTDRRGLDCSAFAQLTYRDRFGIALPRDTSAQRAAGTEIPVERAQPGDLLFFDTGLRKEHVGIYAGEQQFLHVSTRAGVTLSSLLDPYWAPRLRCAVRPRD